MPAPPAAASEIPRWPTITVALNVDGSGTLVIDGRTDDLAPADLAASRAFVLERVAASAATVGRPVRLHSTDPDGEWELAVHPDGHVDELAALPAANSPPARGAAKPLHRARPVARGPRQAVAGEGGRLRRRALALAALLVGVSAAATLALTHGPATVVNTPAGPPPPRAPQAVVTDDVTDARAVDAARRRAAAAQRARAALRQRIALRQARAEQRRAAARRSARNARRATAARRAAARTPARSTVAATAPASPVRARPAPPPPRPPSYGCGEFDFCGSP